MQSISSRVGPFAIVAGVLVALCLSASAAGQVIQQRPLRENPYRSPGGSCVYGGKGELLFAPKGAACPSRQDELQGRTGGVPTPILQKVPPGTRDRVRDFFGTHSHIGDEIVRARRAVEIGDRAAALEALDHVFAEVSANKAGAEDLLREISDQQPAR